MSSPAADTTVVLHDRHANDRGFTLVELVVAMALAFVVLAGCFYLAGQSFQNGNVVESTATTTDSVQRGIDQLTHDLEHATAATVTATSATLTVPVTSPNVAAVTPAPTTTVTWTCTASVSCTRSVGGGPAVTAIPGLVSATLTPTYASGGTATGPSYVSVYIQARVLSAQSRSGGTTPRGVGGTLVFNDGAALRNFAR
ncbi:prepilin-type N-terminal cleavage/methylation domain-containing protein [Paraconexibacter antarcticus]|uniref:Prepilin-type N-terminal cleavage/methylation domain-containing protein n=1 Tax=Paraconexibacter antarcticus TaxID=2949664 RepID=A0ABY5DNQ0_9ACTN|nr:prepilin-type N-terminal cleavage/methylation domain-containing protein [Paraconexibacter antarcticus]UTI62549.1 prepilin-type N-terminal cleavage/methylation domain-containing protein [Paraconexibacter antarcticus]